MKPSWQINFVSGRDLFQDRWWIHHFEYYDRDRGVSLGGRTRIITVELDKVRSIVEKPVEGMSAAERWAAFLRYAGDLGKRELVNGLMEAEEGIAMAGEMLLTVSRDEVEQAQKEMALKIELDWQSDLSEARKEGLAEGEAKARQEKFESARRLKALGVPPDKIAAGLGLSPEDVEAL